MREDVRSLVLGHVLGRGRVGTIDLEHRQAVRAQHFALQFAGGALTVQREPGFADTAHLFQVLLELERPTVFTARADVNGDGRLVRRAGNGERVPLNRRNGRAGDEQVLTQANTTPQHIRHVRQRDLN